MENEENLSELRKKIISTIDLLQEILDIADQVEADTDKMESEYNEPDFVYRLISDSLKSDSLKSDSIKSDSVAKPKKPCMKHWASTLSDRVWEKFREDAIAVGDLH